MNTLVTGPTGMIGGVTLVLLIGAALGFALRKNTERSKVLTQDLSEPLDGIMAVKVEIDAGPGNLTIERLTGDESLLASGALQYLESQGPPTRTLEASSGQAMLTLSRGDIKRSGFHFPWAACMVGAYEWMVRLNPTVLAEITARSSGGNLKLDLTGIAVTHLLVDNGGGNVCVVLPDKAADLSATVKTGGGKVTVSAGSDLTGSNAINAMSGAGSVEVYLPGEVEARIRATSGLGKVSVDSRFSKIDAVTYESPGYERAANKVEINLNSGAGSVRVVSK